MFLFQVEKSVGSYGEGTNDDNNPIAKTILMKNIGLLGSGAAAPNEA